MPAVRVKKISRKKRTFCDHWLFTTWREYSHSVSSWLGKMAKECKLSMTQAEILVKECNETGKEVDEEDFWKSFNAS